MGPETQNACGFTGYFSAIQSNAMAWSSVDIFASHEYGCGTLPSEPSIAAANKEYWETEVDTGTGRGDSTGDGIASALPMATTIHNDLTACINCLPRSSKSSKRSKLAGRRS
jgi:hypothetical protein